MSRKKLTAALAKELASLAEQKKLETLTVKTIKSGKTKGTIYVTFTEGDDIDDFVLTNMLNNLSQVLDQGEKPFVMIEKKEGEHSFVHYRNFSKSEEE